MDNSSDALKQQVLAEVEAHRAELIDLSLRIHANPELGLEEVKASAWLTEYLEGQGFRVERGVSGLPTAFKATYGQGKPVIAFVAEYDALPDLGHACGHNIIAATAAGAAIAARPVVNRSGGTLVVVGTPGEETYGCKATMVDRGAFAGIDAAMMVHPATKDVVECTALACSTLEVDFFGKAAHAAASPERGINALDAVVLAYNCISSLRQHIRAKSRIHGIITKGGEAANIVPSHTSASYLVRAEDQEYLEQLKERVLNCFTAASLATGARFEHRWGDVTYLPLVTNSVIARLFTQHIESLGRKTHPFDPERGFGSTDMGNVSQAVPSLHAFVAIAPPEVVEHSPEFAEAAGSDAGQQGLIDGARALALTAADLISSPDLLEEARQEFASAKRGGDR